MLGEYICPSTWTDNYIFPWVSLKPDRKTADKTAKINCNGRASCMTGRPHMTSSAHQTVTLLATMPDLSCIQQSPITGTSPSVIASPRTQSGPVPPSSSQLFGLQPSPWSTLHQPNADPTSLQTFRRRR